MVFINYLGEGDDGKLGHGNKASCDRPRIIEALRGRDVLAISCGGAHSAAITASGMLNFGVKKEVNDHKNIYYFSLKVNFIPGVKAAMAGWDTVIQMTK